MHPHRHPLPDSIRARCSGALPRSRPRRRLSISALLPTLGFLVLAAAPGAVAAQSSAEAGERGIPQTYDWHLDVPLSAVTPWGQAVDTTATRLMRSWTTAPEFTSRLVDHLPLAEGIPSPMEHFGHPFGRPDYLHTSAEFYGWYEALAAASPNLAFEYMNETEEGRRFALVQIGSPENLGRLEEIRQAYHRLTEPRETSREEMEALIQDLPMVHLITAGLHAPETGQPEAVAELAYRLAVSDDPMIREIRDEAVVFIFPLGDPDGWDRVVEWYRVNATDVREFSDRPPGPPFWGTYIRHDINRDGFQLTQASTRQMLSLFEHWKMPVGIDLHESVPFLYVSTGTGPYNENLDAILRHEWQWVAHHEVTQVTAQGMPGAWTHDFFDGWNPGYWIFGMNNRNANARFYETFGNSVPQTMRREVGANWTSVEWFRANPPHPEVDWSIRNNLNYAQTGLLHSVHLQARNRREVLRNYWQKNWNAVEHGRTRAPHAWVIPADQGRRADVSQMLNLLLTHGVEIHRADAAAEMDGVPGWVARQAEAGEEAAVAIRQGDFLIRADQPYANFVRNLMEIQHYPEDAPRPYDDVAWTFPLLYNVQVHEITDPAVLESAMTLVDDRVHLPGSVRSVAGRSGPAWWAVRVEGSAHSLEARWALGDDLPVYTTRQEVEVDGDTRWNPGSWLIPTDAMTETEVEAWAREYGLEVVGLGAGAEEELSPRRQTLPRIAVLHSWRNTQDDGAVRFALDDRGVPYTYFPEDRLREGNLRDRFDVILFPEQGRNSSARQIFEGLDPSSGPIAWERMEGFPSLGHLSTTSDMTGGMGLEGLQAIRDFIHDGGTFMAMGSAATLPVEMGLVRGVTLRSTGNLFSPGSIVKGEGADRGHPILAGYDESFPVFDRFGPYFSVSSELEENVVLRYAPADEVFLSGLVLGRGGLGGHPAVISVPQGDGFLVLYGVRALHRNQTRGSMALAWNAILNWDDLGPTEGAPAAVAEDADTEAFEFH